mmetsp:Transcript_60579/g.70879  ORF Transcript_60579/g.70879 Transcript_60579/m.70879 type:complete len:80 (+) Transcript_60579:1159-1398(+)
MLWEVQHFEKEQISLQIMNPSILLTASDEQIFVSEDGGGGIIIILLLFLSETLDNEEALPSAKLPEVFILYFVSTMQGA